MCIRYVETEQNTEIKEIFLGFLHAKHTTGAHIADILLRFMEEHELPLQKLRAQGYDGGSNMSGKHNGVQAIIKRDAPEALYVHCKAHCLNLAVVHACKEPTVRTMMAVVQECGFAFHYSAKRLEAFISELQDDDHVQEAMQRKTKLKTLCETRWTSRSDALTTFKNALPVVVHSLEYLSTKMMTKRHFIYLRYCGLSSLLDLSSVNTFSVWSYTCRSSFRTQLVIWWQLPKNAESLSRS